MPLPFSSPMAARSVADDRGPPLSLGTVMLWLSICAVYLAIAREMVQRGPQTSFQLFQLSGIAMLTSSAWTGLLVVSRRILQGRRATIEPGAWLLFSLGIILAIDLAVGFLADDFVVPPRVLRMAGGSIAFSLPMISRRLPIRWKLLLVVLTVVPVWPLIASVAPRVAAARSGLAIVAIGAMLGLSFEVERRGFRGGWLHWVGVVCLAAWLILLHLGEV